MGYLLHLVLNRVVGFCVFVSGATKVPFKIKVGGYTHLYAPYARELLNIKRMTWYNGIDITDEMECSPICKECKRPYSIEETKQDCGHYFPPPCDYETGSSDYCLACWLGVGPNDITSSPTQQ